MITSIMTSFIAMLIISSGVALYYYYIKQYKFIGKIYGGIIFAFIGAILFNYILNSIVIFFTNTFNINVLSVLIGAGIFIKILNKVTP